MADIGIVERAFAGATRGRVARIEAASVCVSVGADGSAEIIPCDILEPSIGAAPLAEGDEVLVLLCGSSGDRGIVLGRVVRPEARADSQCSDELVVEARDNLVLRCGDGSITIRKDGKILIKGKDLVSHALRINRIKGGAVAIN